jgi:GH15 family glucan-1,4-alpha-glucosidase
MSSSEYLPLEEYGIIGNMVTASLISRPNSSIDFLCYPYFDSPALFCKLLDCNKGGYFKIEPILAATSKQLYHPSSNVLTTRYSIEKGIAEVTNFFPCYQGFDTLSNNFIIRKVEAIRGKMDFKMECKPTFNYALDPSTCTASQDEMLFTFATEKSNIQLRVIAENPGFQIKYSKIHNEMQAIIEMEFSVTEDESIYFILGASNSINILDKERCENLLFHTDDYWYNWIGKCTYRGRWREMVQRSALTMKLMTFQKTGAIIASPTFSLPEKIGGKLNWDYRYVWIRDAAFTVYGFLRIGLVEEAEAFVGWIENILEEMNKNPELRPLKIMYDIRGAYENTINNSTPLSFSSKICEIELDHLSGYRNSKPVRIGNKASEQTQLDIYGELMDAIYLCDKYCKTISYQFWNNIKELVIKPVLTNWKDKDSGIWELRRPPCHYLYSKVMCWVALDRAIRLTFKHSLPGDVEEWTRTRDEIKNEIMQDGNGWNPQEECFVQHYGSNHLDASNLIMGLVFFLAPSDPRFLSTLRKSMKKPKDGGLAVNGLVFRFNKVSESDQEGAEPEEETFTMCSFWLIEAMARAGANDPKLLKEAVKLFESVTSYANGLGLFSEEISLSGELVGNFPQAFTHFSFISAAFNIDRTLG